MKKGVFFLLLFSSFISSTQAQTCSEIKIKYEQLNAALNEMDPDTYYDLGDFLAGLYAKKSDCLDPEIIDTYGDVLFAGLELGSPKATARYLMIFQYGLYDNAINREYATNSAKVLIEGNASRLIQDSELGWVTSVIYLDNCLWIDIDRFSQGYEALLFENLNYLVRYQGIADKKASDKNSMIQAKNAALRILSNGYLFGTYIGEERIDYKKGIEMAAKLDDSFMKNQIIKLLTKEFQNSKFQNPAGLAYLGAEEVAKWMNWESSDWYSRYLVQSNSSKVDTKSKFLSSFSEMSPALKTIIQTAYPNKTTEQRWERLNSPKLKEPKAYANFDQMTDQNISDAKASARSEQDAVKMFQIVKAENEKVFTERKTILELAGFYQHGKGVMPNGLKAIEYYKKILYNFYDKNQEYYEAAYEIARIYDGKTLRNNRNRTLVPVDWEEASKYYKMAAPRINEAYVMLAEMAVLGVGGLPRSESDALAYLKASRGAAGAYVLKNLIEVYKESPTVFENDQVTVSLMNKDAIKPIIIASGKNLEYELDVDFKNDQAQNALFLYQNQNKNGALKFSSYSTTYVRRKDRTEKIWVSDTFYKNGARVFGNFYITGRDSSTEEAITLVFPVMAAYMPPFKI